MCLGGRGEGTTRRVGGWLTCHASTAGNHRSKTPSERQRCSGMQWACAVPLGPSQRGISRYWRTFLPGSASPLVKPIIESIQAPNCCMLTGPSKRRFSAWFVRFLAARSPAARRILSLNIWFRSASSVRAWQLRYYNCSDESSRRS